MDHSRSLGARWIHSMSGAPLENHWINITDDKVESLSVKPAYASTRHLGEHSVLLPSAINAHAHLELSQLKAPLDVPSRSMPDWVASLLAFRRSVEYSASQGIQQAIHRPEFAESTIAVADIVPPGGLCPPLLRPPLLWLPFVELIAWNKEALDTVSFGKAPFNKASFNKERGALAPRYPFGLSPHAPHTVCPALLEKVVDQKIPIAMHLAETLEELQLLRHNTGPLLEMMRNADPNYDPKSVLIGKRPMDYLQLLSAASSVLVIHGNYLDDEELRFLAAHRETMSVVYCPRSHAYFRHSAYPLRKMLDYGVQVLLGTDSLASVPDLSLAEEMRFVLKQHPTVSPEIVFRMGTWEGAAALHLLQEGLGIIQSGSPARFAVL